MVLREALEIHRAVWRLLATSRARCRNLENLGLFKRLAREAANIKTVSWCPANICDYLRHLRIILFTYPCQSVFICGCSFGAQYHAKKPAYARSQNVFLNLGFLSAQRDLSAYMFRHHVIDKAFTTESDHLLFLHRESVFLEKALCRDANLSEQTVGSTLRCF